MPLGSITLHIYIWHFCFLWKAWIPETIRSNFLLLRQYNSSDTNHNTVWDNKVYFLISKTHFTTRIHSSGMHTVRSSSHLSRGTGIPACTEADPPPDQAPHPEQTPPPLGADTPGPGTPRETCCKACWDTTCNACWDTKPLWTDTHL